MARYYIDDYNNAVAKNPLGPRKPRAHVTNAQIKTLAEFHGLKPVSGAIWKEQQIYKDPKSKMYYVKDIDGHNGGYFKGSDNIKKFKGSNRLGTYDENLKWIGE